MLAPTIVAAMPAPVVVMDADAPTGVIAVALAGMPAIATAIAGHIGRGGGRHGGQRGRAGNGAQSKDSELHSHLHSYEVDPPFPKNKRRNTVRGSAVCLTTQIFAETLEGDPETVAPVTTAFVIGPPAVVAVAVPGAMEVPIVRVIFEGDMRPRIARLCVPAIAFAIAGDVGGCRHCISQRGDAGGGAKNKRFEFHEFDLP